MNILTLPSDRASPRTSSNPSSNPSNGLARPPPPPPPPRLLLLPQPQLTTPPQPATTERPRAAALTCGTWPPSKGQRGSGRGAAGGNSAQAAAAVAAAAGGQPGLGNLDFLRNNAQFQQLRQIVQQQPMMLEPILQQLGAGNPQLAQLIAQNPEQFLSLLSEDADDDAPLPPGAQAIAVTEEERDAIERVSFFFFFFPLLPLLPRNHNRGKTELT